MTSQDAGATESWTIARVLSWATTDFKARGVDAPRLDAELLLALALGIDRIQLILQHQRPLEPAELSRYRDLIKRRRLGEPVSYLLGEREFYGLTIRVDPRVLIPRPDTETLVDVALERTRERSMYGRALDLCTGSGCVAIAFASRRPCWRTTAVDASAGAAEVARDNVVRLGFAWSVGVLDGDLFEPLADDARFELVTANPPYVPHGEIAALDAGIRDFEPRLALDGGDDGLTTARRIVAVGPSRLEPGGVLAVEVGAGQSDAVARLFEQAGFVAIERRRDYGGHERVVSGIRA